MSKKKSRRVAAAPLRKPREIKPDRPNWVRWVSLNLFGVVLFGCIGYFVMLPTSYYGWVYNSLLCGNMEFIREHGDMPLGGRYASKIGTGYTYLASISEQTPDTAIILYPDREDFFPAGVESPFPSQADISNKIWALRFLYPRKLILPGELEASPYRDRITHVAIVNGRGLDRLPYRVDAGYKFGVLPMDPNSLSEQK